MVDNYRKDERQVAVYKGDELLFVGTVDDAATHLGVVPRTIRYYLTPHYQRRRQKYHKPGNARYVELIEEK